MPPAITQPARPPEVFPEASPKISPVVSPGTLPGMLPGTLPGAATRLHELSDIIRAYNEVTENLQRSHEALTQQVAKLQEQLASTDAQLQRSKRLAALGEMAAGIAHEVRNPLAAIELYAEMIVTDAQHLETAPRGVAKRARAASAAHHPPVILLQNAQKIRTVVRSLDTIVRDVLIFARELTPRLQPVELEPLFMRVLDTHRRELTAGNVRVEVHVERTVAVIHVDPDLLFQALVNLVRNALEAMAGTAPPSHPPSLHLAARLQQHEQHGCLLTLRDTGPGIAPADCDRIFNPFFTTRAMGTGLGLAIVHRIVDAHRGSIRARSDQGAVFEMALPHSVPTATAGHTSAPPLSTAGACI